MEEVDLAKNKIVVVEDLGASGENVSPPTIGLEKVDNGQAFPWEEFFLFFCLF